MKKAPEEVTVVPFGRFIKSHATRFLADVNHTPVLVDKLHMHDALQGKRLLADLVLYGVPGNLLHAATVEHDAARLPAPALKVALNRFQVVGGRAFISYRTPSMRASADFARFSSLRRTNSTTCPASASASAVLSSCGQTLMPGAMIILPFSLAMRRSTAFHRPRCESIGIPRCRLGRGFTIEIIEPLDGA